MQAHVPTAVISAIVAFAVSCVSWSIPGTSMSRGHIVADSITLRKPGSDWSVKAWADDKNAVVSVFKGSSIKAAMACQDDWSEVCAIGCDGRVNLMARKCEKPWIGFSNGDRTTWLDEGGQGKRMKMAD
jgi:hypothetical protein